MTPDASAVVVAELVRRLTALAHTQLTEAARRLYDSSDAVDSALASFVADCNAGDLPPDLDQSSPLQVWNHLARRVLCRCARYRQRGRREAARAGPAVDAASAAASAEVAVAAKEIFEFWLAGLGDFERAVVLLRLEGKDTAVIATQLGTSRRTVQVALKEARERFPTA